MKKDKKEKGLELILLDGQNGNRVMWCASSGKREVVEAATKSMSLISNSTGEVICKNMRFKTRISVFTALKKYLFYKNYFGGEEDKDDENIIYEEGQTLEEYLRAQNLRLEESESPAAIYKDKFLFACPHCGKIHLADEFVEIKDNEIIKKEAEYAMKLAGDHWLSCFLPGEWVYWCKTDSEGNIKYTCPECHKDCTHNYIMSQYIIMENNIQLDSFSVFDKDDKVIVNVLFSCFYLNKNAKSIAMKRYRARAVYNTVTGQAYIFPVTDPKGKKQPKFKVTKMMNATYSSFPYLQSGAIYPAIFRNETVISHILDKLCERHHKDAEYRAACYKALSLYDPAVKKRGVEYPLFLSILNRMPFLTPQNIYRLATRGQICYLNEKKSAASLTYFSKTKTIDDANEAMTKILTKANIKPNKTIKKLISDDVVNIFFIKMFKKHGFTKLDLLPRYLQYIRYYLAGMTSNQKYTEQNITNFLKELIHEKGEVDALETLKVRKNYFCELLADSANMWEKLKAAELNQKSFLKGNIQEIHDKLEREATRIKNSNIVLKYTDKETEKFNREINGYSFRLAKDTYELIKVGAAMHICVGSYREFAINKSCYIVVGYDSEDYPVMCLEIDHGTNVLRQAKAVCNNKIQEYKAEALREWVALSGVKADKCYDYNHIAEGNIQYNEDDIYRSTTDYHNLEVNEDGIVVNRQGNELDDEW